MKHIFTAALIAALVSTICVLVIQSKQESDVLVSKIEQLDKVAGNHADTISTIYSEITRIRDQFDNKDGAPLLAISDNALLESEDFSKRIEALESAVNQLKSSNAAERRRAIEGITEIFSHSKQQYTETGSNPHDALAEEEFQNDAGLLLDNYSESIAETLHTMPGIEIHTMDCRDTICKITYSGGQPSEFGDDAYEELEIVDKLAQSIEGHNVEVRYASDSLGNEVIYVQLK